MLNKLKTKITPVSILLACIFLLALVLRLIGLKHGYPFIFHIDEPALVRSATGILFDINPGHFDWPHLYFYLNTGLYILFIKLRGLVQILGFHESVEGVFPIFWRDPLIFYYLSRVFSAFLGALTILPVYLAGKELFSSRAGLFAALAIALTPFHVFHSNYALIDVPMTFWVAWVVYFSARILSSKNWKNYILAGLCVGLATSTKYNGAFFGFTVVLAHVFRVIHAKDEKLLTPDGLVKLLASGLISLGAFLLGTPFALFDFQTFLISTSPKGALWQFHNVGKVNLDEHVFQFITVPVSKMAGDLGYTFLLAFCATFFYALVRLVKNGKSSFVSDKNLWLIIMPVVFFTWYVSGFDRVRSHYFIAVYPLFALSVGFFANLLIEKIPSKYVAHILVFLVFVLPVFYSFKVAYVRLQPDTRNSFYDWMLANIKESDILFYDSKDLVPVMEKFSRNPVVNEFDWDRVGAGSGYIVLDSRIEAIQDSLNIPPTINILFVTEFRQTEINGGPNIYIYGIYHTDLPN